MNLKLSNILIVMLLINLLLAGCRPTIQNTHSLGLADPLNLQLDIESAKCLQSGDTILIRLSAKNGLSRAYLIDSGSQPTMDIKLAKSTSGVVFFRWSEQFTHEVTHQMTWQANETKRIEMTYSIPEFQPVPGEKLDVIGVINDSSRGGGTVLASLCLGSS